LTGAHLLAKEQGVKIVGIPASIDNDIGCTSMAIGVDTALNTIVDACDRISDTARAHRRAFVVEVMGRDCGYLAMASAVAAGADAVLFREQGRDEAAIVDALTRLLESAFAPNHQRQRVLVIKSEGVKVPCTRLVRILADRVVDSLPGVDVRATVLGHLVRGGAPSYQDRALGGRLALGAVDALLSGATDEMVAWQPHLGGGTTTGDPQVHRFGLAEVLSQTKALLDGSSPITQRRVAMMENIEGILGL
jgi:6-phosphofructokinase 1